ncbi:hypothetical protein DFH09DRAFT_489486 [Mycena vulgaris]|nr:hypothetical protein DFH09DRAFT_489486 [Mycena vulgaris]
MQIDIEDRPNNVIVQTRWGNSDKVIMLGAHLDSVPAEPGINDNGVQLVTQLTQFSAAKYAIRFAWWSSEELGRLGSQYYVEQLPQSERDKITAYINIDMSASPNYILAIQDNDNSGGQRPLSAPTL